MSRQSEINAAASRFITYIRMGWEVEESFEIAYDSVFDIIGKEDFLSLCQVEVKKQLK